jgi:hypothetical protein
MSLELDQRKRMSLKFPRFFKYSQSPGARISRALCAISCLFLLTAAPAFAEPVRINQVVQTLSSSQGAPDLKLNNLVSQDPAQKGGTPQSGPRSDNGPATQGGIKTDSIISGVTIAGEGKSIGVEAIEEGEVEGTICDCGDILVAGGAFPKWPFLFLAAVPLAFIHDCNDCDNSETPTPTPPATPTPTPPGVPEPASIFLFGTGVAAAAAGLRRRFGKKKLDQQLEAEESDRD